MANKFTIKNLSLIFFINLTCAAMVVPIMVAMYQDSYPHPPRKYVPYDKIKATDVIYNLLIKVIPGYCLAMFMFASILTILTSPFILGIWSLVTTIFNPLWIDY